MMKKQIRPALCISEAGMLIISRVEKLKQNYITFIDIAAN